MQKVSPKDKQTVAAECRNRAIEVEAIKDSLLKSRELLNEDPSVFMASISLNAVIEKLGVAAELLSEAADSLYKNM